MSIHVLVLALASRAYTQQWLLKRPLSELPYICVLEHVIHHMLDLCKCHVLAKTEESQIHPMTNVEGIGNLVMV